MYIYSIPYVDMLSTSMFMHMTYCRSFQTTPLDASRRVSSDSRKPSGGS